MKRLLLALLALVAAALVFWFSQAGAPPVDLPSAPEAGPDAAAATAQTESEPTAAPMGGADGPVRRAVIPPGSTSYRITGRIGHGPRVPLAQARVRVFEHKTDVVSPRVPGAQMWQAWMTGLVRLGPDAGLVAEAEVAADGSFVVVDVRGTPGSTLALVLDHDLYGLVSPHPFSLPAAPATERDLGEIDAYLGAYVYGRLIAFDPVAGTEVRLACEADSMAPMRDPSLFRLQVMGSQRLVQRVGADGTFAFRAVPQTPRARILAKGTAQAAFGAALALLPGERRELLVVGVPSPTVVVAVAALDRGPLVDAQVTLLPRAIDGVMARTTGTRSATTGADGEARLAAVTPGKWFLRVSHEGLATKGQEVDVTAAADLAFRIELDEGGVVSGRVVDASGAPVADAGIAHQPSLDVPLLGNLATQYGAEQFAESAARARVRSDADGRFRLPGLTYEKDFTLAVAHPAYIPTLRTARVGADDLVVELSAGATLLATIVGGDGETPIATCTATLLRMVMGMMEMPVTSVRSDDAEGRLDMRLLPAGSFKLRVEAAGFAPHEQDVRLVAGETLDLGKVALVPPARVAGRVVDPRGRPVPRAKVRALRGGIQDNEMFAAMTGSATPVQTAADGSFEIGGLVPGRVRLQASATGFAPTRSDRLEIAAGILLRDVVLTLGHGGAVEGRVLLPAGADPSGWRVIAGEIRGGDVGQTEPGPDGSFRIENLLAGRYNVQAMNMLAMDAVNEAFAGDIAEGRGMDIGGMMQSAMQSTVQTRCLVKDGETTTVELDARSMGASGARVSVEVLVGDRPLADGFAEVSRAGEGAMHMAVIVAGAFTLEGQQPGNLLVQVRQGIALAPVGGPVPLTVAAGQDEQRVTLRLPGGRLGGRVVHDSTGEPLAAALVRVRGAETATEREPDLGFTLTDTLGQFEVAGLGEGTYTIVADDGLRPQGGQAGGRLEGVRLAAGETRTDLVLRARPAAGVAVRVLDDRGIGVPRAMLIATDADGNPIGSRSVTFADGEGRAFLGGLPAGSIRVAARGSHFAPGVSEVREVAPAMESEITVRLSHGTSVEVTVAGRDGEPWAGAMVAVRIGRGPWIPASLLQPTRAGAAVIDLGELPPGPIRFQVFAPGHGSFEVQREIPTARRASLVLAPDAR